MLTTYREMMGRFGAQLEEIKAFDCNNAATTQVHSPVLAGSRVIV